MGGQCCIYIADNHGYRILPTLTYTICRINGH